MNIFLIPSWYPDENNYVQGIFVKEQFEALAKFFPDDNFIISNFIKYNLPLKKPGDIFKSLSKYNKEKKIIIKKTASNLVEIKNSALTWSEKFKGDIANLIEAGNENYFQALEKFQKIDLIHAHVSYPGGFLAMELKRRFNIPYVITEHMGPFPFKNFLRNGKLSKKISTPVVNSNRMIAVSTALSKSIESLTGIKAEVIPNMVNEEVFITVEKIKNKDEFSFLTVSSLIKSKGISELLEAIKLSVKKNSFLKFVIAGTGEMEIDINDFIKTNELVNNVILKTKSDRKVITEEFKNCDAYILPSRHESFGISYIEAMACGKPVIATDCGGPADFINKENGILVPVGDVGKISEAILKMAANIKIYDSQLIRNFFLENFSSKVVCEKIYSVYKSVIDAK